MIALLTKQEALEILELNDRATRTDMDKRYAALVKRYRAQQDPEKLEQISVAYDVAIGRYIEPEPEKPGSQRKVFGRPLKDWMNTIHYGKATFFTVIIIAGVLIYFILTSVFTKSADFRIGLVGEFFVHDDQRIIEYTREVFPDREKPLLSTAFIHASSFEQNTYAAQTVTFMLMLSQEDVIFTDRFIFDRYADVGVFFPIEELYQTLLEEGTADDLGLKPLTATITFDNGESPRQMICGIDFSDTQLLSALGIMGRDQIATVSIRSKDPEGAVRFILGLLRESHSFDGMITPMPSATPIPTPTPNPTASPGA